MTKKKKPKKPKFVYLFTEIPQQAHELFVDAKLRLLNRRQAGLSEVLPIAENMFSELREERQTSLDELNISIYEAVQDNLYGLGRAVLPSDANRTRVRTQNDMQQRMSSLKIKEISLVNFIEIELIARSDELFPAAVSKKCSIVEYSTPVSCSISGRCCDVFESHHYATSAYPSSVASSNMGCPTVWGRKNHTIKCS